MIVMMRKQSLLLVKCCCKSMQDEPMKYVAVQCNFADTLTLIAEIFVLISTFLTNVFITTTGILCLSPQHLTHL